MPESYQKSSLLVNKTPIASSHAQLEFDNRKQEIIKNLEENHGQLTKVCGLMGFAWSSFYRWLENNPDVRALIDKMQIRQTTHVEETLYDTMIKTENLQSMQWWLARRSNKFRDKLDINQNLTVKVPSAFNTVNADTVNQNEIKEINLDTQEDTE